MADNIDITPGSGKTVATDDVSGVQFQKIKVNLGGDGVDGDMWDGVIALSAVDNAVLDTIAAAVGRLDNSSSPATIYPYMWNGSAFVGISGDATYGIDIDVTRSALPSGAATAANQTSIIGYVDGIETLLGTIDADTGNVATSLGIMDDWDNGASDGASVSGDVAHDSADAGEPVKIGGKAQSHLSDPAEVSAANDRVNALMDRVGRQAVYQGYVLKSAVINTSTSGDNTIVAAVMTKRIRVLSVLIVSDGTTDVRWESGASGTALTGQVPLQAREGYAISSPWGLFETTAVNTLLNLELTAAVNVHGFVTYIEVDD